MKRSPLLVVFFTVFLDLLGFGLVLPLLPAFAREYGASPHIIGLLFASYSAMQFFFAPVWGRVSDRIGRRPVLMLSISGSVASYLIFAFAPSLAWLFVSRLLAGVMAANLSTAQAYVADVTAPEDRAKGMGMVGAAFGLGFVIGPMIAIGVGRWGQIGIGLTAAGLSFTDLLLASVLLKESLPPERRGQAAAAPGSRLSRMARALAHPTIGVPIIIFFLATFAFSTLETTLTLFLGDRVGLTRPEELGKYFGFLGVLVALIQGGLTGRLAKRAGEARLVFVGCVGTAVGLALLPEAHTRAMVLAALAVIGLGQGMNVPSINSLISRSAGAEEQGSILGVNQGFSSLARVVGPAAGGWLYQQQQGYPYFAGAALMGAASLLALRVGLSSPAPGQTDGGGPSRSG